VVVPPEVEQAVERHPERLTRNWIQALPLAPGALPVFVEASLRLRFDALLRECASILSHGGNGLLPLAKATVLPLDHCATVRAKCEATDSALHVHS
jgi:hypothetical protein